MGMWFVYNQTDASISLQDFAVPTVLLPNSVTGLPALSSMRSIILGENIASMGVCVVGFQSFISGYPWMPLSYAVHPMSQEIASGQSSGMTVGPFTSGILLVSVTTISAPMTLSWSLLGEGLQTYPVGDLVTIDSEGNQAIPFSFSGAAGFISWTITAPVTFSIELHLQ